MFILPLSYNPLAIRMILVFAGILLVLGVIMYQIHMSGVRRRNARQGGLKPTPPAPGKPAPPADSVSPKVREVVHPAVQPSPPKVVEPAPRLAEPAAKLAEPAAEPGAQMFHESVRPSSPLLGDFGRIALIVLAIGVAISLLVVLAPQSTIDKLAENFRLRNPQAIPQERISLLYLGDETKGKEFHIRGVIRNISTQPLDKVDATVRLFAPDGSILETTVVRMDVEQIVPDGTASFNLNYPDYNGQFSSYSVDFKLRQGDPLPYKDMRQKG